MLRTGTEETVSAGRDKVLLEDKGTWDRLSQATDFDWSIECFQLRQPSSHAVWIW